MPTIAILGTMDTKGVEHGYVADLIKQRGHGVLVIDVGTGGAPKLKPDISRVEVAAAAGGDFGTLAAKQDRGDSVSTMSRGAPVVLAKLAAEKRIDGVISLGGGGGTASIVPGMGARTSTAPSAAPPRRRVFFVESWNSTGMRLPLTVTAYPSS